MNKIWDRKSFEVAFVAGMKQPNDHAELTKVKRLKKTHKKHNYSKYSSFQFQTIP